MYSEAGIVKNCMERINNQFNPFAPQFVIDVYLLIFRNIFYTMLKFLVVYKNSVTHTTLVCQSTI